MDTTAPSRRTRLSAGQRQELILQAATEVFTAAGYHAAKVSDVATRIGVTEPVIFQNFGSKASLYAAVLDRMASRIRAELHDLTAQHGSVARLLAHLLSPLAASPPAGAPPHGPGFHRALFADAATLAAGAGPAEPARQAARTLAGHLADVLRRGQADGEIRADADPEAAAWLLLSILSARPLRDAMPDRERIEPGIGELVLQALVPPGLRPTEG